MNEVDTKQAVYDALRRFSSGRLDESSVNLLGAMGYRSERRLAQFPSVPSDFIDNHSPAGKLKPAKALLGEWRSIHFLFQLTSDEITAGSQIMLDFGNGKRIDDAIIESYLFFAIELTGDHYTRTQLASITREVNKLFPMPVMVLFRHRNTLTLSIINRRLHRLDESKDVLEKVTLIKDINFTSPHRAHIEILFDLSLAELYTHYGFTSFVELHRSWEKALDSSELNRRFFKEIANWYFWALQNVTFPKDAGKDEEVRNATSVIRLITRLIFIWFIKEKHLVPNDLFDQRKLEHTLNYSDPNGGTYYKAILQNLFFATLNQEMNTPSKPDNRRFRSRSKSPDGRDPHYNITNLYRYENYFRNQSEALDLFSRIPFLNGGLFECLDKPDKDDSSTILRIDGFSDRPDNELIVPDFLFFSDERDVDLNEEYGTQNKRYKVRGLIDTLNRYKFTIEENTPIEEEVALDPELLGKVFENLLASYNPETRATARKQTGSYYTPREIVNYMVDESLITYLNTRLKETVPSLADMEELPELLREVFAYTEKGHPFNDEEVASLIDAVYNVKVLDPACGSGAFPMGVLHKLVFILGKLDPQNELWKKKQLAKAGEISDVTIREKLIADIEEAFERNALDYGRKLYLIENCIYGVDIQPIAVQIAKLRFFISLVVDQKIDDSRENRGILPLPNLETRFVAADTLIGLDRPTQAVLRNPVIDQKEEELESVRQRHFAARTQRTKQRYRQEDTLLRAEISLLLKNDGFSRETTERLARWDPYDQNASADFFDQEWMFAVSGGFDVVIANPPYISSERFSGLDIQQKWKQWYQCYAARIDVYCLFYERGVRSLLKQGGGLAFISSNKFMRAGYGKNLRGFFTKHASLEQIIDFGELPVFEAGTDPSIVIMTRRVPSPEHQFSSVAVKDAEEIRELHAVVRRRARLMPSSILKPEGWTLAESAELQLLDKLNSTGQSLRVVANNRFYRGIITGLNEAFVISDEVRHKLIHSDRRSAELIKPWLQGHEIKRWRGEPSGLFVIAIPYGYHEKLKEYPAVLEHLRSYETRLKNRGQCRTSRGGGKQGQHHWLELDNNPSEQYLAEFERPKIVFNETSKELHAFVDRDGLYVNKTGFILLPEDLAGTLAILNSSTLDWLYRMEFPSWGDPWKGGRIQFRGDRMSNVPIPSASDDNRAQLSELAGRAGRAGDAQLPTIERDINDIVYSLFDLNRDEIAIIETADAD